MSASRSAHLSVSLKFLLAPDIRETFLSFDSACVRKVKTGLTCSLKICPGTAQPDCETMFVLKRLEIEMPKCQ